MGWSAFVVVMVNDADLFIVRAPEVFRTVEVRKFGFMVGDISKLWSSIQVSLSCDFVIVVSDVEREIGTVFLLSPIYILCEPESHIRQMYLWYTGCGSRSIC